MSCITSILYFDILSNIPRQSLWFKLSHLSLIQARNITLITSLVLRYSSPSLQQLGFWPECLQSENLFHLEMNAKSVMHSLLLSFIIVIVPVAANTGQNKNRASLYPMAFSKGSMTKVIFPPIIFIKKSVMPIMEVYKISNWPLPTCVTPNWSPEIMQRLKEPQST